MLNSLIKYLKQVKDFRACQGRRHPLWLVLLIVILSRLSGHEGYREMVSLFSQETGLVLVTEKWESKKGSELAVAQEIIGKCGLKGKIITADALHCNSVTAGQILESGNEYLIPG